VTTDQCIPSDNVTCYVIFLNKCKNCRGNIDVNAAVAGVATPSIWPAGVVLCWWPPIFWQVFYFFPSAKFLNTASRCHFHLQCAQCTVFNSTDEQNSLQIHTFSGKGHSSSPDPTSIAAYGASILSLRHSTCDPTLMSQWRWRPWGGSLCSVLSSVQMQCPDPATTIKSAMVTYIKTICLAFEICGAQGCIYLQPPLSSTYCVTTYATVIRKQVDFKAST